MSYPSQHRLPYGMTTMQPIPGMPGMSGVAMQGIPPGMTPVQVSRLPNGMSSMYQAEKQAGLYPGASAAYPSLAQQSYLAQSAALGQPGAALYGASSQHPTYLPVSSPSAQQRYMVSAGYPGSSALVSSPSMIPGAAAGYPLMAGTGYAISTQGQAIPVAVSSQYTLAQSQYPTYIGSQLTPLQVSPSQSPYASATGHPLYPSSPYASLQMAGAQIPSGQIPSHIPGRSPTGASAGLPFGYPAGFYTGPWDRCDSTNQMKQPFNRQGYNNIAWDFHKVKIYIAK